MMLVHLMLSAALIAIFGVQGASAQVLDDSLRESAVRGCTGSKSVIIRTRPGAREALRKSLAAQGRRVKGEFPSLDAITADVRCGDTHVGARSQAGDVRSVTVFVRRRRGANVAVSEIVERRNARAEVESTLDTRVDDRNADGGHHVAAERAEDRLAHAER